MMKAIFRASLLILAIAIFAACSRKNDTFMNRNYHAVTTEYNILYNGNLAFEDAKKQLAAGYRDNFWEILPIERIEIKESLSDMKIGESQGGAFDRAEEKATKAIQKHSMYFGAREHNPKIAEAYLLLGKARYYDGRFIPALDAFNFIINHHPTSSSMDQAKVWRAKTNIRLKNEEYALENLKKLYEQSEMEDQDRIDAAAMIAQAYMSLDSIPEALEYIKIAAENVKDKELKGRYTFIKGQIYNHIGEKDSANIAFDEVIAMNRRTSRSYLINAYMEKAQNFDYEEGDREEFMALMTKLEKDRENRPFLDRINYQLAEYYRITDSIETAVTYYNRSIKNFRDDRVLQSKNYQTLAEINFDNSKYRDAGAYYDSTLTFMQERSREWRRIKKKRENLDDVILYEEIATTNDSILRLAAMSDTELLAYFTAYTAKLKEEAIKDSIANAKREQGILDNEFYKKGKSGATAEGGTFYFYNHAALARGKEDFRRIWGNRKLEDNWRLSNKASSLLDIEDDEIESGDALEPIAENEMFNPEVYIARVPKDEAVIDSLSNERNFAYYQLGLIYKEKFKELDLAYNRLETLLTNKPEERLIVPAKYNLFKIYEELGMDEKAAFYKNDILTNYADTRYAEILRNPNTQLATDESSPEYKYKELYKDFEDQKYAEVIDLCDEYITLYHGTEIVPKFELLKATAIGKQDGFEAYKAALNFVSLNYANTEEGRQAQDIFTNQLPKLELTRFTCGENDDQWKLIYTFAKKDRKEAEKLKETLDKAIAELKYSDIKTSIDYYNSELDFVVIHGLKSELGARGFGQILNEKKEYKVKNPYFEICSPNYKRVQIHKNLDDYLGGKNPAEAPRALKG